MPPLARSAVQLEYAKRMMALLNITLSSHGRIFFNPVSDEEFEETIESEDTFQDAETTQFLSSSAHNILPIDPVTSASGRDAAVFIHVYWRDAQHYS